MDFGMEAGIFLAYAGCLLAVCFFGRLLVIPVKYVLKLLLNSIIGGAALLIINGLGGMAGIWIPVNVITAVVAGLAGAPGIVMLLIYFQFFV